MSVNFKRTFWYPQFFPKMNEKIVSTTMIPQVGLFSFVFWKNLKTPKRHFEINWRLIQRLGFIRYSCDKVLVSLMTKFLTIWDLTTFIWRQNPLNYDHATIWQIFWKFWNVKNWQNELNFDGNSFYDMKSIIFRK